MKINNIDDVCKTYCMSLARRPDRREQVSQNIAKVGIEFEFFDAVDGQTLDINYDNVSCHHLRQRPGGIAICYSFVEILKRAKELKLPHVLILEDDVDFSESFREDSAKFLSSVPEDWDMIYFGGNHLDHFPIQVNEHAWKCVSTRASQAIIFKETTYDYFIEKLLEFIQPNDDVFATSMRKRIFNAYTTIPPLTWQYASYSDLEEMFADYQFLKSYGESDYDRDRERFGFAAKSFDYE